MKKLQFLIAFILLQFTTFSQKNCNAYLKSMMAENLLPSEINLLIHGNIDQIRKNAPEFQLSVRYSAGDIASVRIATASIPKLLGSGYVKYLEFNPSKVAVMNDTMMVRNRIKPVKQGLSPLAQAYDGSGVIVGIIDTGIDFTHPDFKNSNGSTRIQFIWDQNQTSGSTVPQPFNYGIEWTAAQINASVCTHNDLANYGHGTHVSGTAAGNGLANGFHEGIASKSDIIVVAMNFNNNVNTIYADAIQYIFDKATAAGKPCVINASVGNYYGSHDATDLEAMIIDNMLINQPGRVLVAAAGNAGNIKFHTKTVLNTTDTLFTWISSTGSAMGHWLYADTADVKNVKFSVGVNRPGSTDLGRIAFQTYTYALNTQKSDTIKFNGNRIGIIKTNSSINSNGVYELYHLILADSLNYKWRIESCGNGKHDGWNFSYVSTGLPTATVYPNILKYVMPDTISSIVSSFQCSNQVITVGNYINLNKYYDVNNTLQVTTEVAGKLKETSSIGPTRKNIIKPDIAATGANVFSAMALGMQANLIANLPSAVAQGSMHVQGGGTSASSPVVAGLAALYLQAYPNASNQQVKQAIMNCAYTDGFTGSVPNNAYGYGKLDGKAAMLCTIFTDVVKLVNPSNGKAFPNPFKDKVTIEYEGADATLWLYDITGKLLHERTVARSPIYINSEEIGHYKGMVIAKLVTGNAVANFKLVAE